MMKLIFLSFFLFSLLSVPLFGQKQKPIGYKPISLKKMLLMPEEFRKDRLSVIITLNGISVDTPAGLESVFKSGRYLLLSPAIEQEKVGGKLPFIAKKSPELVNILTSMELPAAINLYGSVKRIPATKKERESGNRSIEYYFEVTNAWVEKDLKVHSDDETESDDSDDDDAPVREERPAAKHQGKPDSKEGVSPTVAQPKKTGAKKEKNPFGTPAKTDSPKNSSEKKGQKDDSSEEEDDFPAPLPTGDPGKSSVEKTANADSPKSNPRKEEKKNPSPETKDDFPTPLPTGDPGKPSAEKTSTPETKAVPAAEAKDTPEGKKETRSPAAEGKESADKEKESAPPKKEKTSILKWN